MADPADTATDYQTRLNAAAESARVRYEGDSAHECEDCGEPIPQIRREAIPGVSLCVECQEIQERRRARHGLTRLGTAMGGY